MHPLFARSGRPLGILTAAALVVAGLLVSQPTVAVAADGPAPNEQRSASTATTDPLPTVQIDSGIVVTQVVVGNLVFAGGTFSNARPAGAAAGTSLMPRTNLLSFDITTGIATSFAPVINGPVKSLAVSPDGTRLYVGGTFTTVNGQSRFNLAAFDVATGALLTTFKPAVGGSYVNAIVATNSSVYVGGLIGAASGVTRKNFAAFSTSGALLGWAPTSDLQVDAMVMAPAGDKLIAAGRFSQINGATQRGLAALDLTTGSLLPWLAPATVTNGWGEGTYKGKAGIFSLTTDATSVYGTGWVYANASIGNLEGTFAADGATGAIKWIADCHGDHYGVYSDGTNVYTTGHQHACESMDGPPQAYPAPGNLRHATAYTAAAKGTLSRSPQVGDIYADWSGYPAPAAINWYPDWVTGTASGQGQAGWTITGNGTYVVFGGEFPYVNGKLQQGLVRFSNAPAGGPKQGPRLSGDKWTGFAATSNSAGTVRITIPENWDRDDLTLSYSLYRNGTPGAIQTTSSVSRFWDRQPLSFVDTGQPAGSTQTYRVVASDPDGNTANSIPIQVTVSSALASAYSDAVLNDGASLYWRLGGAASSTEIDWSGPNTGATGATATPTAGAIANDPSLASTFTGAASSLVSSVQPVLVGADYSLEFWFKTRTTTGGKLVGYGRSATGASSSYDRHVYMTDSGTLIFGNYDGNTRTISTTSSYNDGAWHHVVATQSAAGMTMFVDGASMGANTTATRAESYTGYWRVGGDNLNGWPDKPTSTNFTGQIDDFSVYPAALTAGTAQRHFALGSGAAAPTAAFDVTSTNLTASLDASRSSAPGGQSLSSYTWTFGDGTTGTGPTVTHAFPSAGAYPVTLTVRATSGLTDSITRSISVVGPHTAPTAVIASSVAGLTATLDGGGSTASDGATVTGFIWDFGDGSTSTLVAPVHQYAAAGTYPVSLRVTDSLGAASPVASGSITVDHAAPVARFTSAIAGLGVSVDASASTASDGQGLTYAWSWGDGSASGSGVTASHTYGSSGARTVTLTVTDGLGVANSVTASVLPVTATFLVSDDFERAVTTGWGTAPVGGAWSGTTGFNVSDGAGRMTNAAGQTRTTQLGGVSASSVDATLTFATDRVATGGGSHFNLLTRKTAAGDYRVKVRTSATGVVTVNIAKLVGATETLFASKTLTGYTATAGSSLTVRFQIATAGSTTQLQTKVWPAGATEPTAWTSTATDAQPELQGPGQVGVSVYVTGSATNGPVTTSIDNLTVR